MSPLFIPRNGKVDFSKKIFFANSFEILRTLLPIFILFKEIIIPCEVMSFSNKSEEQFAKGGDCKWYQNLAMDIG